MSTTNGTPGGRQRPKGNAAEIAGLQERPRAGARPGDSAVQSQAQAYVAVMNKRVPLRRSAAYLCVRPTLLRCPSWSAVLPAVQHLLPGVRLAAYGATFTSHEDFKARFPQVLGASAGLVVIPGPRGYIEPGAAREIRQAAAARLPIVILARRGLVALPDCRIEALPEDDRRPWRELRIVLSRPAPLNPALRASLRAMGARRPGRRP